ncbi:MAG: YraN family protein, partial [Magnetospirillum sp.]|nr:YraN family protein [Magnetospirillum sp.]
MSANSRTGKRAEIMAAWWLRLKGYAILARGWTNRRGSGAGEIDIVAKRGRLLVFVEVKA